MTVREFTFTNHSGRQDSVKISVVDSTEYAFRPWTSAELLSQSIYAGEIGVSGRTILELGAGTGLCGIAALKNNAKRVIFTDLVDEQIAENIQNNLSMNNISNAEFCPCDWNDVPTEALDKGFDLILASDCLFDEDVVYPFVMTLSLLLHKNPSVEAYIAYEDRGYIPYLTDEFARYELSLVPHPSQQFNGTTHFLYKAVVEEK